MNKTTILAAIGALATLPAFAEDTAPKLGPNAIPITERTEYLRSAAAPDYWAFTPFVKPQFTTSACSIASITAAVNGLRGLPANAEDTITTQPALLEAAGSPEWAALSAEGGDGVRFDQLATFAALAVEKLGMLDATVDSFKPASNDGDTLAEMREWLSANEASAKDVLSVYFNQGVVTGDWDGPHVAIIGAYDQAADMVLILEVDQDWYIPYWTPAPVLLEAMLKPTSAEHGPLQGETGGFVRIAMN
ncbi:phytochelatin synthase family protein, partial [Cribrihabitans sp. XS_ASV171]